MFDDEKKKHKAKQNEYRPNDQTTKINFLFSDLVILLKLRCTNSWNNVLPERDFLLKIKLCPLSK